MKSARGFTLIEVLMVMAIIAVLVTIIAVAINPTYRLAQARDRRRIADLTQIANAINAYYVEKGVYPVESGVSTWESEVAGCWGWWEGSDWHEWNAGSKMVNDSFPAHQFLQALVDNGDLKRIPIETHPIKDHWNTYCGYRYVNKMPGCGSTKSYAVLYTALETTKPGTQEQRPSDVTACGEGSYPDDYAIYLPY